MPWATAIGKTNIGELDRQLLWLVMSTNGRSLYLMLSLLFFKCSFWSTGEQLKLILGYSNLWTCQLASDWKEYENMTTSSSDFRPPILNFPLKWFKSRGGEVSSKWNNTWKCGLVQTKESRAGRADSSVGWLPLGPGHRSLIERQRGA